MVGGEQWVVSGEQLNTTPAPTHTCNYSHTLLHLPPLHVHLLHLPLTAFAPVLCSSSRIASITTASLTSHAAPLAWIMAKSAMGDEARKTYFVVDSLDLLRSRLTRPTVLTRPLLPLLLHLLRLSLLLLRLTKLTILTILHVPTVLYPLPHYPLPHSPE